MLDEAEFDKVSTELSSGLEQVKAYRQTHGSSIAEARAQGFFQEALALYARITGFNETNPDVLFHHRLSLYGPPCGACQKPLRTPQASVCAACGSRRPPTDPSPG